MTPRDLPAVAPHRGALRLGIDQPADWWPTVPRLKSYEAAGFGVVQVTVPAAAVLLDADARTEHAAALAGALELTGLELVLDAPAGWTAGDRLSDATLRGALDYAVVAGATRLVYRGRSAVLGSVAGDARLAAERRSLTRLVRRAARLGIGVAVENLAPAYPMEAEAAGVDPSGLAELVEATGAGVCLDVGHAHVVAERHGVDVLELIEPLLGAAVLVHLHDNFGAAVGRDRSGAVEPLRLDLHLAPGAGTVPWRRLAPRLLELGVPMIAEVRAPGRPEPGTLAVMVRELLGVGSQTPA